MESDENAPFVVGDVVMLKSGGPAMTVTHVDENNGVPSLWVSWFAGPDEKSSVYPLAAVERLTDGARKSRNPT